MYGLWYITFGLFGIGIIFLIILIVAYKEEYEGLFLASIILSIAGFMIGIILLFCSIFNPIRAHKEVIQLKELYPTYSSYVELIASNNILDGNFAQNNEYMEKIFDYNYYIAEIKSDQAAYGCFSKYFLEDLSNLYTINLSN